MRSGLPGASRSRRLSRRLKVQPEIRIAGMFLAFCARYRSRVRMLRNGWARAPESRCLATAPGVSGPASCPGLAASSCMKHAARHVPAAAPKATPDELLLNATPCPAPSALARAMCNAFLSDSCCASARIALAMQGLALFMRHCVRSWCRLHITYYEHCSSCLRSQGKGSPVPGASPAEDPDGEGDFRRRDMSSLYIVMEATVAFVWPEGVRLDLSLPAGGRPSLN